MNKTHYSHVLLLDDAQQTHTLRKTQLTEFFSAKDSRITRTSATRINGSRGCAHNNSIQLLHKHTICEISVVECTDIMIV